MPAAPTPAAPPLDAPAAPAGCACPAVPDASSPAVPGDAPAEPELPAVLPVDTEPGPPFVHAPTSKITAAVTTRGSAEQSVMSPPRSPRL